MIWALVGWYREWHGIYGLFPTEELAQLVAERMTPPESLYDDGHVHWRHEHETSYSGIIRKPFEFNDETIIQWSIQCDSKLLRFVDDKKPKPEVQS